MRREKPIERWTASHTRPIMMARSFGDVPNQGNETSEGTTSEQGSSQIPASTIGHERARELVDEQTHRLLPPQEANALADHLLVCDRCFRYAQDVAHQERQSGKHSAIPREQSYPE